MRKTPKTEAMQKKHIKIGFPFLAAVLVALLLLSLVALEQQIRPVARSIAEYQSRMQVVHAIQAAINAAMKDLPAEYDTLYSVQYTSTGAIQSIAANTRLLNALQYELEKEINTMLSAQRQNPIQIPIGTLSGFQLLSGKGSKIDVWAIPLSAVESHMDSEFISVGINQTKLQVNLIFSSRLKVLFANNSTEIETTSSVCIAEILIIGEIPQVYLGADDAA